jgi:hypothetical protein
MPQSKNIHIPNFDKRFVADRNPDKYWLIERTIENIDVFNSFVENLPRDLPWEYQTTDDFKASTSKHIHSGDFSKVVKLWWTDMLGQIQAFGLTSAWRLAETLSSAVWALKRKDVICAALMARSCIETVSAYSVFASKVRPTLNEIIVKKSFAIVADLESELLKTMFASRLEGTENFYIPTNIITIIGKIEKFKDQESVVKAFSLLCEVAHPNMLGRSIYIHQEGGKHFIKPNHSRNKEIIETSILLALSWSAGTFVRKLYYLQDTSKNFFEHFGISVDMLHN